MSSLQEKTKTKLRTFLTIVMTLCLNKKKENPGLTTLFFTGMNSALDRNSIMSKVDGT